MKNHELLKDPTIISEEEFKNKDTAAQASFEAFIAIKDAGDCQLPTKDIIGKKNVPVLVIYYDNRGVNRRLSYAKIVHGEFTAVSEDNIDFVSNGSDRAIRSTCGVCKTFVTTEDAYFAFRKHLEAIDAINMPREEEK